MKRNLDWAKIFGAAFFEVVWVIGLKHASTAWEWIGTCMAILISFYVIISAGKRLPVGTVYSVFVGLGTVGTILSEVIFFGEPVKPIKLILVVILCIGVAGLKWATPEKSTN